MNNRIQRDQCYWRPLGLRENYYKTDGMKNLNSHNSQELQRIFEQT